MPVFLLGEASTNTVLCSWVAVFYFWPSSFWSNLGYTLLLSVSCCLCCALLFSILPTFCQVFRVTKVLVSSETFTTRLNLVSLGSLAGKVGFNDLSQPMGTTRRQGLGWSRSLMTNIWIVDQPCHEHHVGAC